MNNKRLRILTNDIQDIKGKVLKKGLCFLISSNMSLVSETPLEKCLIYLDNGQDDVQDFLKCVVFKKYIKENSIEF